VEQKKKKKKKLFGILRHIYWLVWRNISEGLNFVIYPFSCWRNTFFEKVRSGVLFELICCRSDWRAEVNHDGVVPLIIFTQDASQIRDYTEVQSQLLRAVVFCVHL